MDESSSLILIGVGGSGCAAARAIAENYGGTMRARLVDTDALTPAGALPFTLIGGSRLSGQGAGGAATKARAAFLDDPAILDAGLSGVKLAIVVTCLGGGTGGGATPEILKRLKSKGIASLVFATKPFPFEGEARISRANSDAGLVAQEADVSVILPMEDIALDTDDPARTLKDALDAATAALAKGVSLFWRLLEKPGYIKFDPERLRNILSDAGRARFAAVTASGEDRVSEILSRLESAASLQRGARGRVKTIFLGLLAGDDLRLSEIAKITQALAATFGAEASLELGTVNDEETFSGSLSLVTLLFEEGARSRAQTRSRQNRAVRSAGEIALSADDRFRMTDATMLGDTNLDIPTYYRLELTLER